MNTNLIAKALRDLADAIDSDPAPKMIDTPEQAQEVAEKTAEAMKSEKAAKKKTSKKKASSKKTAPATEMAEKKGFTPEEVRDAIKAYAKKNSRDAAFALLDKFDAKKIADLKPSQFNDVMAAL